MTIADGRYGAYGMTFKREPFDTDLSSELLDGLKTALYINDNSFDDKLVGLLTDAIHDFERITTRSVLAQTITITFEYFKGKNKLPFGPVTITPITGYTITGEYLDGGNGEALTVVYTAGNAVIPIQIQTLIARLFQVFWREDTEAKVPIGLQKQISKYRKRIE